ncbi:hypothetical protein NCCP2165_09520 [Halomonas sp. NCCP-2165]|nr:hypothetical protein NCCP2165_09520 [Halomonas sp. NCCP-2165]
MEETHGGLVGGAWRQAEHGQGRSKLALVERLREPVEGQSMPCIKQAVDPQ